MEKKLNPELLEQIKSKDLYYDLSENTKETRFKLDRMGQKVNLLEVRFENLANEMREAYTKISTKVSTSALNTAKIESLIERHNQVIHMFESRLAQMQKVVDEQEIQLANSLSELQQARAEIARLKKF